MTGSVDKIHDIFVAVFGFVKKSYRAGFDGYTAFAFKLHIVENAVLHFALRNSGGKLQKAVRKR